MKAAIKYAIVVAAVLAWASPARAQLLPCEPVETEGTFKSPEICGFVWMDTNGNGIQDEGDGSGIVDAHVILLEWDTDHWNTVPVGDTMTDGGAYYFFVDDGKYKVVVSVPDGTELSPAGNGGELLDSDGVIDTGGSSAEVTIGPDGVAWQDFDFGFHTPTTTQPPPPGTGTPGYWKNHSWPVSSVLIGGIPYTQAMALTYMGKVSKDKTITLFSSLLAAKLNVVIGNPHGCIDAKIDAADAWFAMPGHAPGSGVAASSPDWQDIADTHEDLDDYNNGRLCAPHRN